VRLQLQTPSAQLTDVNSAGKSSPTSMHRATNMLSQWISIAAFLGLSLAAVKYLSGRLRTWVLSGISFAVLLTGPRIFGAGWYYEGFGAGWVLGILIGASIMDDWPQDSQAP
jgi:hypothetical protein